MGRSASPSAERPTLLPALAVPGISAGPARASSAPAAVPRGVTRASSDPARLPAVTETGPAPASNSAPIGEPTTETALVEAPARKMARIPGSGRVPWTRERHPARHPNLGLAPVDMKAGHPGAAETLRSSAHLVAARALEAAAKTDPTIMDRYDEIGLRRLLRDGELLVERLAMCLASGNSRWLVEYAEWVAPIYRRRGTSLLDLATLCDGVKAAATDQLDPREFVAAGTSLDAAVAVLRRNSRLGGDRHKRNALWKWMYRGV